jgi:hypothetical protein
MVFRVPGGSALLTDTPVHQFGREERSFLLVNLPLRAIAGILVQIGYEKAPEFSMGRLAAVFLRAFPNYLVVRVRIAPGEAYFAPTENLIHDASTEGQTHGDITMTIHGHFKWCCGVSLGDTDPSNS